MKREFRFTPRKGLTAHYYPSTDEFTIFDVADEVNYVGFSRAMGKRLARWISGMCEQVEMKKL